jgi:hypothetical protein
MKYIQKADSEYECLEDDGLHMIIIYELKHNSRIINFMLLNF